MKELAKMKVNWKIENNLLWWKSKVKLIEKSQGKRKEKSKQKQGISLVTLKVILFIVKTTAIKTLLKLKWTKKMAIQLVVVVQILVENTKVVATTAAMLSHRISMSMIRIRCWTLPRCSVSLSHFSLYFCIFKLFAENFTSKTAYWNRDPSTAAAANPLFGSPFGAAGLGLLPGTGGASGSSGNANDRFSMSHQQQQQQQHQNTMAVAASQAASLAGIHPASE